MRPSPDSHSLNIAVLVYEGTDLLDIAGLLSVFESAAKLRQVTEAARATYNVSVVSMSGMGVRTSCGVLVSTRLAEQALSQGIDTLLVAGGEGAFTAAKEKVLIKWIETHRSEFRRIGCCGSGAFILASAGILDARRITTHWACADELQAKFSDLLIERDALFIEDHGIWSSAGATACIDMALKLVEEDVGQGMALKVAKEFVLYLRRTGREPQFSAHLQAQHMPNELKGLLERIMENPQVKYDVTQLVRYSGMSRRSLYRAFYHELRMTPREFVELARLEVAKRLFEEEGARPARVAKLAGFASREAMRRVFRRQLGISPTAYRQRLLGTDRAQLITSGDERASDHDGLSN
jgi:transcriptional regulator GlxA family with amidase domain